MPIHARGGDIAQLAPGIAEASVLWIRNGFNLRHATWLSLSQKYGSRLRLAIHPDAPWLANHDQIVPIEPADQQLRMLYFFSNPSNARACGCAAEVQLLVRSCLSRISSHGVRRVALIRIPIVAPAQAGDQPPPSDFHGDDEFGEETDVRATSARAMIRAVQDWEIEHPGAGMDIYLVDHQDYFSPLLG